jgi:ABC-type sugar transport system substrate-binding protein
MQEMLTRGEFLKVTGTGLAGMAVLGVAGCAGEGAGGGQGGSKDATIGLSLETLESPFWVAARDAIREEAKARGWTVKEAVADGDPNRQTQQVQTFVSQQVDGIILIPKDEDTAMPMIQSADQAGIHIVLFNRAPAQIDDRSTTITANDYDITVDTSEYLVQQAEKTPPPGGGPHQAMVLIGDLGDPNAVERRDGFLDTVGKHPDLIKVVAKVPTQWDLEVARSGSVNALQANPDVSLIFCSSDFLFPSLIQAMKGAGKYHKSGEEGHVILAGFDGDARAYKMLQDKYLDATGVQDVFFESKKSIESIAMALEGKNPPIEIIDKGFVIHQDNLAEKEGEMWGAQIVKGKLG